MATKSSTANIKLIRSSIPYLVICGYIRNIENELTHRIIPESINFICYEFYYFKKLLFCITCKPVAVRTADINFQSSESDKDKASPSKALDHIISHQPLDSSIGSLFITNCCSSNELTIYPKLKGYEYNPHSTITLFKCGGWDKASSHALLVDTNTFQVYNWVLPKICPSQSATPYGNSMVFRPKTQMLYSTGGNFDLGKSIKTLDFHDKDVADWKWESTIELDKGYTI